MAIPKSDSAMMIKLAQEGKQIAKIWREDFPKYEYQDIYFEVYGNGERSAKGLKVMITNRLNSIQGTSSKKQQKLIIDELHDLVWHLYEQHKSNQKKIDSIRKALD
jgi:hypothetical protein